MSLRPEKPTGDARIVDLIRSSSPEHSRDGVRLLLEEYAHLTKGGLICEYGRDRADLAQDAIHDAALTLRKSIDQHDERNASLATWFFSIARNSFLTLLRAEEASPLVSMCPNEHLEHMGRQKTNPSPPSERLGTMLIELDRCIQKLAPIQRDITLSDLRRGGEADTEELARRWKTSTSTIHNARHRARSRLRRLMKKLR